MPFSAGMVDLRSVCFMRMDVSPFRDFIFVQFATLSMSASNTVPSIVDATTALSITFASVSLIAPISTNDYEIVHADGQEGVGTYGQIVTDGNADPFPNVDDVELSIQ
ncbi:hypothetical protein Tco_0693053 [Tanacetum coccineum]